MMWLREMTEMNICSQNEEKERRTMQNAGRNSPELLNTAGREQDEECRTAPE